GKEVEVDTLELRKRTGDLLSNASKNGDLEQALREVQAGKESKQNMKEKASKTLLQASENGELDRVLKEVKSERIDVLHEASKNEDLSDVRAKASEVLMKEWPAAEASTSGELDQALQAVMNDKNVSLPLDIPPLHMMPSNMMVGPAFSGLGMQGGFMFI
ncbi:unnamed protein product, partial [Polarella glacialis]